MRSALLALAAASLASAHFQLKYPVGGFNDDTEDTGPCGGVTPEVSSGSPQITVDQFAVQVSLLLIIVRPWIKVTDRGNRSSPAILQVLTASSRQRIPLSRTTSRRSFRPSTVSPICARRVVPMLTVFPATGAGDFCLTSISMPSSFAGKQGILQVVDSSVDGTLYQVSPPPVSLLIPP